MLKVGPNIRSSLLNHYFLVKFDRPVFLVVFLSRVSTENDTLPSLVVTLHNEGNKEKNYNCNMCNTRPVLANKPTESNDTLCEMIMMMNVLCRSRCWNRVITDTKDIVEP